MARIRIEQIAQTEERVGLIADLGESRVQSYILFGEWGFAYFLRRRDSGVRCFNFATKFLSAGSNKVPHSLSYTGNDVGVHAGFPALKVTRRIEDFADHL
jgi:hypothetical protein